MNGNTKILILAAGFILVTVGWFARNVIVSSGSSKNSLNSPSATVENTVKTAMPTSVVKEATTNAPIPNVTVPLLVSTPTNGSTVKSSTISVKGKTANGIDVFVNDTENRSDAGGNFSASVSLDEGENTIIVVATDSEGNVAEETITVTYDPGN